MARALFPVLAVCFLVAGVFHDVRAVAPHEAHAARHALFAAIDLAASWLVVARPWWAAAPFAALTAQQIASHGGDLVRTWSSKGRIDPTDVAALVVMPLTLVLLVLDARATRRAPPPP